jgi:hypothetical protein
MVNYQWSIKKRNMEDNRDDFWKDSLIGCFSYIIGILVGLMAAVLLAGCTTTKYVPVPEYHTDTVRIVQHQRDSIYLSDSIYVNDFVREDTVYKTIERWRTKYIERISHDTLYQSKVDSIPYPVEVIKEVPAKLTWWQQTRLHLANILIYLILIVGIIYVGKKHIKRLRG